jgi:hypothetical protein
MKRNAKGQAERNEPPVEQSVFEMMAVSGLMLPTSPEDVAAAEAELAASEITLPECLRLPPSLDSTRPTSGGYPNSPPIASDVCINLARAAREGHAIPREIEQRMQADWERAQQQRNNAS